MQTLKNIFVYDFYEISVPKMSWKIQAADLNILFLLLLLFFFFIVILTRRHRLRYFPLREKR